MAGKPILKYLLGDRDKLEYDRYFITMICLVATIFLFLLCIFHIIMGLKLAPVFLAGGSALVLFGLYLLVRLRSCLFIPKIIVTILGLFLLDLTWYAKFMSLGPVLFFIFAFGALIVWAWNGKSLWYLMLLYLANIIILFTIEYTSDGFSFQYANLQQRTIDIYLSFLLYSCLLIFILIVVKNDFKKEKENAIRSDNLKSAFLANLSHEIRTPMNSIVGFSTLLKNNPPEENRDKYISNIHNSSDNLLRLINELLDLSKIEAGYTTIEKSNFSIEELFEDLKLIFINELSIREKPDVNIEYDLPGGDIHIRSDYLRVKQILSNLLNNAIKFSSDGAVVFKAVKEDARILFSVFDEGQGIDLEDQERIFDRFSQFNHKEINTEGSGIGLSIAKKMVELLNGNIWVNSAVDIGSEFNFDIPFEAPTKGISPQVKSSKNPISMNKYDTNSTVLVVEDDKSSFLLIREILSPLKLDIHLVGDGKDAVEFIESNPETGLVLMDLKLPFMNGYDATRAIKKINSNVVVIAQTAFAMQGDKDRAIQAGCNEYLTKPIDFNELQQLVKKYIPSN